MFALLDEGNVAVTLDIIRHLCSEDRKLGGELVEEIDNSVLVCDVFDVGSLCDDDGRYCSLGCPEAVCRRADGLNNFDVIGYYIDSK